MVAIVKFFPFLARFKTNSDRKKSEEFNKLILNDLFEVKKQLEAVESKYNLISDTDLVEAYIYEERALKARYAYLLRLARTKGVSCGKTTEMI